MREILKDLEAGRQLSDPDPVKRVQNQMRTRLPKRFYRAATVARQEEGFGVMLDERTLRTPGRTPVLVPSEALARLVADEFAAQGDHIDPATMPVTRLVNTAMDGVAAETDAVLEDVLRYSSTDLVCYRAEGPEGLVERQAEAWDPVIDWARAALGARFILAEGVMHVEQPRETIAVVGVHLGQRAEPLRLTCLHVMTTLTGSALLALAVEAGAMSAEEAWRAAHVDEDWNIEQWGEDAEAAARRAARERDMMAAALVLRTNAT